MRSNGTPSRTNIFRFNSSALFNVSADETIAKGAKTGPAASSGITAESRIAEQERQFREMLELCPAGLIIVDEEGRLLFHNWRLRELMGY